MDEEQIPETLRKKKKELMLVDWVNSGQGTELHINGTIGRGMVT
jgi:hypothetical protein